MTIVIPHLTLLEPKGLSMLYELLRYTRNSLWFSLFANGDSDNSPLPGMLLRTIYACLLVGCGNITDLDFWNALRLNCSQEKCEYKIGISVYIV